MLSWEGMNSPCLHQEESRGISETLTCGQRKRFTNGKVSLPYGQFHGYYKREEVLPKIVESEDVTVRLIYRLFFEGKTPSGIANISPLTRYRHPPGGRNAQSVLLKAFLKMKSLKEMRYFKNLYRGFSYEKNQGQRGGWSTILCRKQPSCHNFPWCVQSSTT